MNKTPNLIEINQPPSDAVSALKFSPNGLTNNAFICASSWDSKVRVWEINQEAQSFPKAEQTQPGPILSACWSTDGTKIFTGGSDKTAQMWDLASNQMTQVGAHDAPVKTVHFISCSTYTCLMTGSWDKRLRFWDMRQANPIASLDLSDKVYCADVFFPLAICVTADKKIYMYNLEGGPKEHNKIDSPLNHACRCVSIFPNKDTKQPTGFALGSIEGRAAIHYLNPSNPKDNFTFKCHRSVGTYNGYQEIFPLNEIKFHPVHNTLVTVGSDGKYTFWDKDARIKIQGLDRTLNPITACDIDSTGNILAFASNYDWSKGHSFNDLSKPPKIYMRPCFDDLKAQPKQ